MSIPKVPQWRDEPEPVWINCGDVRSLRDEEFLVSFNANGKDFISFVPSRFIDPDKRLLQAVIIADVDEGLLVDIPVETLTSGPRILVLDSEKDSVLTFSNPVTSVGP